jgi:gliding motility-associated lipoprotein GldD
VYPKQNAVVFLTYKSLKTAKLEDCINDARTMAMKLIDRADDIQDHTILDTANALYGKIYEIIGNEAACPCQFWITDKENHFIRASLYLNCPPQNDSLAPIIDYIKKDMLHLIETFSWKGK